MGSRGALVGRRLMVGLPEVEGGGVADFGGGWETYLRGLEEYEVYATLFE